MRRLAAILAAGILSLGIPAASVPAAQARQDQEAELLRKVEEALRRQTERSRAELLDLVRRELGGTAAPAAAVEAARARVTADLLRPHVEALAADEMEGRNAGFPGCDKAAEYIAGIMKEAGLRPAGDEGTYFQKFRLLGRTTRNVVGLLEGADPALRKECVVLGAHYDHVGTMGQGNMGRLGGARGDDTIYNGADDNASGTAALLAAAAALGREGYRPRRTLVFVAFSGEEEGLLGSRHYTNHPPVPLDQHVLMINLDMVGRNSERPVEIHGAGSAEGGALRKAAEAAVGRSGLKARIHDQVKLLMGDSDHASFGSRRIPFVFFFSGFHSDYHRVTDHADRVHYDNLARVAQTALLLAVDVADAAERLKFSGAGLANPFRLPDFNFGEPPRSGRMLGVTVQELDGAECDALGLDGGQGALRVENVHAGGAAAGAGMQPGDVLLGIAGVKLPRSGPRDHLRRVLAEKVRPGAEVVLSVLRKGETLTLKAKWSE